jgi:hypothetical protein
MIHIDTEKNKTDRRWEESGKNDNTSKSKLYLQMVACDDLFNIVGRARHIFKYMDGPCIPLTENLWVCDEQAQEINLKWRSEHVMDFLCDK